jgi:hypothetical protein
MDRHEVARRGQPLGLLDDRVRVLVAQQNEGNFCHSGNSGLDFLPIVRIDTVKEH